MSRFSIALGFLFIAVWVGFSCYALLWGLLWVIDELVRVANR